MWQWLMVGGAVLLLLVIWCLLAMGAKADEAMGRMRITGLKPVPPGEPAEHE